MELIRQILREAGADPDKAFTVVPGFGGYFKSVKKVEEYSPEKITLLIAGKRVALTGENLAIDKYFQQDLLIKGNVTGVNFE